MESILTACGDMSAEKQQQERHAVIITAYKGIAELTFLLEQLHGDFNCYVHVDQNSTSVLMSLQEKFPDVRFYSNYRTLWGSMAHLQAILDLLHDAMQTTWSYAHIISGEDIPVKSNDRIYAQLRGKDSIYLSAKPQQVHSSFDGRTWRYYWPYTKFSRNYKLPLVRYANLACIALQVLLLHPRRKGIGEFRSQIYQGFVWGTYSRESVEYILRYLDEHPEYRRDLTWCKIPEELCFQNILMHSDLKEKVVTDNLRYQYMTQGDWGPRYLEEEDLDKIGEADLFARKMKIGSPGTELLIKKCLKNVSEG